MKLATADVVPAAPFSRWVNERIAYWERRVGSDAALARLCAEIGWTGDAGMRRLYRYRRQLSESYVGKSKKRNHRGVPIVKLAETFSRKVVEEALHHADVRLGEVYPYEALIDEFQMEYNTTRDQAQRLADAWIEGTWRTAWENVGLFVAEEDRPRAYCAECRETTRLFAGTCGACGSPNVQSLVAAVTLRGRTRTVTDEAMAQARWLREQYQLPYQSVAAVMAVYHGVVREESVWRRSLRAAGVAPAPRGSAFKAAA